MSALLPLHIQSIRLYRHILKSCKKLPSDAQAYYKETSRDVRLSFATSLSFFYPRIYIPDLSPRSMIQKARVSLTSTFARLLAPPKTFVQFRAEDESERISSLIQRGYQSVDWVMKKVRKSILSTFSGSRPLQTYACPAADQLSLIHIKYNLKARK